MTSPFRLALALGLVLATGSAARADSGVIVLEPVSALGFFARVGHAGTYLSNICPDGSPIKMRLCLPGESGGVVIRSSTLSENDRSRPMVSSTSSAEGPGSGCRWVRGNGAPRGCPDSQVLAGDPRLAALVLAAVIDYQLHQPEARREGIQYVDGLFTLFRQASGAIGRDARGASTRRVNDYAEEPRLPGESGTP